MKQKLAQYLPDQVVNGLRAGKDALDRSLKYPSAYLHPWRRESIRKLASFQNCYCGERCFVIGNGPSLKETDISLLKDEYTFGMNRVYLAFEDWGFPTSFLVSVNDLVIEQSWPDLQKLRIPKFFSWRSRRYFPNQENLDPLTHFLFTTYTGPRFALNAAHRLWEGATVTYVCLQLAFHMGFSEVILIGVDHSFVTQGKANQTVISPGEDPNHFHDQYFGKGFRWQLPDLETSEIAYRKAREVYQAENRILLDATIGGALNVFPKVQYQDLFKDHQEISL